MHLSPPRDAEDRVVGQLDGPQSGQTQSFRGCAPHRWCLKPPVGPLRRPHSRLSGGAVLIDPVEARGFRLLGAPLRKQMRPPRSGGPDGPAPPYPSASSRPLPRAPSPGSPAVQIRAATPPRRGASVREPSQHSGFRAAAPTTRAGAGECLWRRMSDPPRTQTGLAEAQSSHQTVDLKNSSCPPWKPLQAFPAWPTSAP